MNIIAQGVLTDSYVSPELVVPPGYASIALTLDRPAASDFSVDVVLAVTFDGVEHRVTGRSSRNTPYRLRFVPTTQLDPETGARVRGLEHATATVRVMLTVRAGTPSGAWTLEAR